MPTLTYSRQEFCNLHGTETIGDLQNRCEWLPDGARIDQSGFYDPPSEPQQLLKAKRRFVSLKLTREEQDYEEFFNDCSHRLSWRQRYGNMSAPGPPPNFKDQLEHGKQRIAKLRIELSALDRELAALPDAVARRAYQEQRQQQTSAAGQALNELMAFRID